MINLKFEAYLIGKLDPVTFNLLTFISDSFCAIFVLQVVPLI